MATVTNWIDHLSADEVQGAIYPGVGSEGILVIIALVLWIGWHILQNNAETKSMEELARKRRGANDHKSNITDW
ncbi:MAG: hypothetical protein CMI80_02435 [Candidatus Pelagibacter sp.]|nr:hypothetical protein [Candidatus Pelagibacter sp.]|tara:strand:- start:700 stop:921 length:222 start_codon:yes stop_codon:yes gene_type:complete